MAVVMVAVVVVVAVVMIMKASIFPVMFVIIFLDDDSYYGVPVVVAFVRVFVRICVCDKELSGLQRA